MSARQQTIALLTPGFAACAEELGLVEATLEYAGEPPSVEDLEARLERDLERGVTGLGPHLDDITVQSAARDLRSFGSQGEQRLAVLSLLLAEAEVLGDRHGAQPLVLLDDVLSELDAARRHVLTKRLAGIGQAIVTATDADAFPAEPAQLIVVAPGRAAAR